MSTPAKMQKLLEHWLEINLQNGFNYTTFSARVEAIETYFSAWKACYPQAWDSSAHVLTKTMGIDILFDLYGLLSEFMRSPFSPPAPFRNGRTSLPPFTGAFSTFRSRTARLLSSQAARARCQSRRIYPSDLGELHLRWNCPAEGNPLPEGKAARDDRPHTAQLPRTLTTPKPPRRTAPGGALHGMIRLSGRLQPRLFARTMTNSR